MKTQSISINDNTFILHPSGAMYWQDEQMLLITDVHFGKVTHFRKHGIAVPQKVLYENFNRLDKVVVDFNPKSIYFLGDLFHSNLNTEWLLFETWVKKQSCDIVLIKGNHDIISPLKYQLIGIKLINELEHNGFLLTHHPEIHDNSFNISGHIHPGVRILGKGKQQMIIACFHISKSQLTLPAFGTFTGKYIISPAVNDRIYATTGEEVILVDLE